LLVVVETDDLSSSLIILLGRVAHAISSYGVVFLLVQFLPKAMHFDGYGFSKAT
jgi:hypothetical protein